MTLDLLALIAEYQAFADKCPKLRGMDVAQAFHDLAPDGDRDDYCTGVAEETRQRIEAALSELAERGPFTHPDLEDLTGLRKRQACHHLSRLEEAERIRFVGRDECQRHIYVVTEDKWEHRNSVK